MYVLKNIAHSLRAEIFQEKISKKGKFQAMFWQQSIIGKLHIKDMNYDETLRLVAELYCKKTTGHSLSTLTRKYDNKKHSWKTKNYYKKIVKVPFAKVALFFRAIKTL